MGPYAGREQSLRPVEAPVNTFDAGHAMCPPARPRLSVDELLAAKNTPPILSLDDLAAETFGSDEELQEFLAFTHAERLRDTA